MKKIILLIAVAGLLYSGMTGCKSSTSPVSTDTTKVDTTGKFPAFEGLWVLSSEDGGSAPVGYIFLFEPNHLIIIKGQCHALYNITSSQDTMRATKFQDSCGMTGDFIPAAINTWSVTGSKLTFSNGMHTFVFDRNVSVASGIQATTGILVGINGDEDFLTQYEGNNSGFRFSDPDWPSDYIPYIIFQNSETTNAYFGTNHPNSFGTPDLHQYGYNLYILSDDNAGNATVSISDGSTTETATVTYQTGFQGFYSSSIAFSTGNGGFLDGLTLLTVPGTP